MTDEEINARVDQIAEFCSRYDIRDWSLDQDSIDAGNPSIFTFSVDLSDFMDVELPVSFKRCDGSFICGPYMSSLKGCPKIVWGDFDIQNLKELRSFEHGPDVVMGNVNMTGSGLVTLKHAPKKAKWFRGLDNLVALGNTRTMCYEMRYLLLSELHGVQTESPVLSSILIDGRTTTGTMPSELIPGKIKQLRDMDNSMNGYFEKQRNGK